MTASLSNVAVTQFRDQFLNEFEGVGMLSNPATTMEIHNVVGRTYQWPIIGNTVMLPRGAPSSNIDATDVSHTPVTVNLEPYALKLVTDIFQQAEVNADERTQLVKEHAKSSARRIDQFIINALNASATTNLVPVDASNLTKDKLLKINTFFTKNNVPPGERHIAVTASQIESLLKEEEITSMDFNSVRTLLTGEVNSFLGLIFHTFGDREEGGLPLAGDIRTVFAWHQSAVGSAFSIDPTITVEFDKLQTLSWVTISRLQMGSVTLLDEGIVKIECDETL